MEGDFFFLVGGMQRGGKREEEWGKIVVVCKKDLKSEKLKWNKTKKIYIVKIS